MQPWLFTRIIAPVAFSALLARRVTGPTFGIYPATDSHLQLLFYSFSPTADRFPLVDLKPPEFSSRHLNREVHPRTTVKMKTSQILAILGFSAFAAAQSSSYTLAPSPTESYLCESHGDHWHCEGARATTGAGAATTLTTATTTATATEDHDDDHDHASGTGSLAPSPTESLGCTVHGDHWHCEGPAEAASTAAAGNATVTTTTAATTTAATTTAAPSGTDAAATSASGAAASSTDVPAGAARVGFGAAAIAAALMAF